MNHNKTDWPDWIKVGQKIQEKGSLAWIATIMELTERGFRYEYDTLKPFIAREGSYFAGGEYYIDEALKDNHWWWEPINEVKKNNNPEYKANIEAKNCK